ncbi:MULTISPECIES: TrbG/VirB9 family P-type conjugative transfer protein, partial [unclassified Caballeronia]|uniref:TrbG/VirB9 family P-type conjugative transfer protein n=1 Tax=unclassified Caballeronia TaxID=2646786 RepID=UPI002028FA98
IIKLQHREHRLGKTIAAAHPFHLALANGFRFNVHPFTQDDRLTRYFNDLLVNTLHLTTNLREYDFTLIASPAGGMFYQTVRFQYPRAPMARVSARDDATANGARGGADSGSVSVAPDKLNWDYSVEGRAEFTPETVFDDGHAVWMRMPAKAQEWPVPFILDHGDRVVANFIRRGDFLVLQRLADEIVLRSGKDEVTVTRGRRRLFGVF